MSTAVLLNDSWKPKVIQLIPFKSRGLKNVVRKGCVINNSREELKRSFPVLAVTRRESNASESHHCQNSSSNSGCNETSCRQPAFNDSESELEGIHKNKTNRDSYMNIQSPKRVWHQCSSRNSNDSSQTPMADDLPRKEFSNCMSPQHLLKSGTLDSTKYIIHHKYNKNKLTPGEEQLQRFQENYAKEQSLKSKKYKLNVNQLPRSTTPIQDNDPDKLNMKHVINFLQKQKSAEKPKSSNKTIQNHSSQYVFKYKSPQDRFLFEKVTILEQSCNKSREFHNGSASSVRSSPVNKRSDNNRSPDSQGSSVLTVKSVMDRTKRSKQPKCVKEFKLHRFLSISSDKKQTSVDNIIVSGLNPSSATIVKGRQNNQSDSHLHTKAEFNKVNSEVKYRSSILLCPQNDCSDSENSNYQKTSRTTALHRKVSKKLQKERQVDPYIGNKNLLPDAIRLPTVTNVVDSDSEDVNSKNITPDREENLRRKYTLKDSVKDENGDVLENSKPIETNHEDEHNEGENDDWHMPISVQIHPRLSTNVLHNSSFYPQNKREPVSVLQQDKHVTPKQLCINIPNRSKLPSTEIIKLSLRKEKDITADKSYMIDMVDVSNIQNENILDNHSVDYCDIDPTKLLTASSQQRKYLVDDENFASSSMAKSCIQVRKKLKENVLNILE